MEANNKAGVQTGAHSEFKKFDDVMKKIISVPKDELKRREKEWQKKRAKKKRASS